MKKSPKPAWTQLKKVKLWPRVSELQPSGTLQDGRPPKWWATLQEGASGTWPHLVIFQRTPQRLSPLVVAGFRPHPQGSQMLKERRLSLIDGHNLLLMADRPQQDSLNQASLTISATQSHRWCPLLSSPTFHCKQKNRTNFSLAGKRTFKKGISPWLTWT